MRKQLAVLFLATSTAAAVVTIAPGPSVAAGSLPALFTVGSHGFVAMLLVATGLAVGWEPRRIPAKWDTLHR